MSMGYDETQNIHIIPRNNNHFGYSPEEDEIVTSSDFIRVPYYEHFETYHYETTDKAKTLQNIINNFINVSQRLIAEKNESKIKRFKEILKNDKDCILRDKEYIEKQMKINVTKILSEHTL